jgi:hypothetical protein
MMSASRSGALRQIVDSNFRVIAKPCCALFGGLATDRFDVVNVVDQGGSGLVVSRPFGPEKPCHGGWNASRTLYAACMLKGKSGKFIPELRALRLGSGPRCLSAIIKLGPSGGE